MYCRLWGIGWSKGLDERKSTAGILMRVLDSSQGFLVNDSVSTHIYGERWTKVLDKKERICSLRLVIENRGHFPRKHV